MWCVLLVAGEQRGVERREAYPHTNNTNTQYTTHHICTAVASHTALFPASFPCRSRSEPYTYVFRTASYVMAWAVSFSPP